MVLVYLAYERYGWQPGMRVSFPLVSPAIRNATASGENLYEVNNTRD